MATTLTLSNAAKDAMLDALDTYVGTAAISRKKPHAIQCSAEGRRGTSGRSSRIG
jgi:hypothetical protein